MKGQHFVDVNNAALTLLNMPSKDEFYSIHPSQISPKYQPDGELSLDKANKMIEQCYLTGSNKFEWMHQTIDKKDFLVIDLEI